MKTYNPCDNSGCLFFIFLALMMLFIASVAIYIQLNKLIELNTPEQINLAADKYIIEIEENK